MASIVEVLEDSLHGWVEYEVIDQDIKVRSSRDRDKILELRTGEKFLWNTQVRKIMTRDDSLYSHDQHIRNALQMRWIKLTGRGFTTSRAPWEQVEFL